MQPVISIIIPAYNVEKYISTMLRCIQNQTFTHFEAIIVNDGSTDGTQKVIDGFCKTDSRFTSYYKENGGVSSARNLGIDKAVGQYLVFWDPDDEAPADSLENLYTSAQENDADMVIGISKNTYLSDSSNPNALSEIVAIKDISKMDFRHVWSFTAANRLFKKSIIDKYNLRFDNNLALGEDGVFWLNYMSYCDKIVGCNKEVYIYKRRFFMDKSSSLTQSPDRYKEGYFDLYITSLCKACEKLFENCRTADGEYYKARLFQELYKRLIRNNIISDMYRQIWLLQPNDVSLMYEQFEKLKKQLYSLEYGSIIRAEKDLDIACGLKTKVQLASSPRITFVLTRNLCEADFNNVAEAIYRQRFPEFEILVDAELKNAVDDKSLPASENLHFVSGNDAADVKNKALMLSKADYIMFIDEPFFPDENTFKNFFAKIKKTENIISLYAKRFEGGKLKELPALKKAFSCNDTGLIKHLDILLSNKVFKVDYLKNRNFTFSGASYQDILNIYNMSLKVVMKKSPLLITTVNEQDFNSKIHSRKAKRLLKRMQP